MKNNLLNNHTSIIVAICIVLFVVPFFWLKPGEIDIGGDSTRLYFYDPMAFLKNVAWYGVSTQGTGVIEASYFYIPFVFVLHILKTIIGSSWLVISIINGIKLSFAFLGICLIVKELLSTYVQKNENIKVFSSITAGLFYIFSSRMIDTWDKALLSHNQIFLNPIVFYLLLKYSLTSDKKYIVSFLILSFVFAPAFSFTSTPPLFAFYPLAIIFIFIYAKFIRKSKINYKGIIITFTLFILLQAFHLVPQIVSLFSPGSLTNTRVFDKESIAHEGIRYFTSVLSYAKTSLNLLLPPLNKNLDFLSFIPPLILLIGLILLRKDKKTFLLTGIFFMITLFLLSANITNAGVVLYQLFFHIPGFSMFRNFIGQWIFVYTFFYALILGLSIHLILTRLTYRKAKFLFLIFCLILFVQGLPLLNGSLVKKTHPTSNNIQIPILMDKNYEEALVYADQLPRNEKILTLPFSDAYYQVLAGKNGGAYIGPSSLSHLTTAKDFIGYQIMPQGFADEFLRRAKGKDYTTIKEILRLLGINYIFHNEDPRIYDTAFPATPYTYVRESLPATQVEYKEFINKIGGVKIHQTGSFVFYELPDADQQDNIYITNDILTYKNKVATQSGIPFINQNIKKNRIFLTSNICMQIKCHELDHKVSSSSIKVRQINPTKYYLNISAESPFFLTFLDSFDANWKLFIKDDATDAKWYETFGHDSIIDTSHFQVNGYANGWAVDNEDLKAIHGRTLILEMTGQRTFYIAMSISAITWVMLLLYSLKIYIIDKLIVIMKNNG